MDIGGWQSGAGADDNDYDDLNKPDIAHSRLAENHAEFNDTPATIHGQINRMIGLFKLMRARDPN